VWNSINGLQFVVTPCSGELTNKVWMDRNGAAYVAESATDYLAYASLPVGSPDGHQLINWNSSTSGTPVNGSTTTKSTTNTPANALFITSGSDWRSTQNDGLWQAGSQVNNPLLGRVLLSRSGRRRLTLQI
jgi:hypothetical protein